MSEPISATALPELKAVAITEKPYVAKERVVSVKAFVENDKIVVTISKELLAENGDCVSTSLQRIEENPPIEKTLSYLMGITATK